MGRTSPGALLSAIALTDQEPLPRLFFSIVERRCVWLLDRIDLALGFSLRCPW